MSKVHIVFNDRHVAPGVDSSYHDWIADLILDVKPDVVIDNGDGADMPSLCSYDRNTRSFIGRNYKADIDAANEANDRLWSRVRKAKKKLPLRVTTEGNHERRITKALNLSPELDGAISFSHLNLDDYYDITVRYQGSTPGIIEIDGVFYAHYFANVGTSTAISGVHPAAYLLQKQNVSCTVGHSHVLDFSRKVGADKRARLGLVNGICSFETPEYAGNAVNHWWRGLTIKWNVENGHYDPEFVSLERLKKIYGQ